MKRNARSKKGRFALGLGQYMRLGVASVQLFTQGQQGTVYTKGDGIT